MPRKRSRALLLLFLVLAQPGLILAEQPKEIRLTATEFSFRPSKIQVPQGEVKIVVTNRGQFPHSLAIVGREKIDRLLDFALGDAEALPFQDASFDAVVSECAISTFLDKEAAAREMTRVLKPRGRLGFADVVMAHGEVPQELRGWLFQAACIADVRSAKKYREVFMSAGFSAWREEKVPGVLEALLRDVQARLLALEVAAHLEKLDLSGFDLAEVKETLNKIERWINSGGLNYGIFLAVKEARHE